MVALSTDPDSSTSRGFESVFRTFVLYRGIVTCEPLTAQAVHDRVRAELDAIDGAHARLRSICTDLAGNAFRIEMAERLETQNRTNRALSYRMFGEIAEPVDGSTMPAGPKVRDVLAERLRLTAGKVKRRFALAARLRPRRSLTGPPLPPELPALAAAVEAGDVR